MTIKLYFLEGLEGKWGDAMPRKLDSFGVPDRKYIRKGEVSRGYVLAEGADAYIKAMKRAFGKTEGECLSHLIEEFKRVMGDPPKPPELPKTPPGKTFRWPTGKKKP